MNITPAPPMISHIGKGSSTRKRYRAEAISISTPTVIITTPLRTVVSLMIHQVLRGREYGKGRKSHARQWHAYRTGELGRSPLRDRHGKDASTLETFLDGLAGEVVSIIPNTKKTLAQIYGAGRKIDFLLIVEKR